MFRRVNTLSGRFALWTSGLLITAFIGFAVFIYVLMGSELARSVDDALQLIAAQVTATIVEDNQISLSDGLPDASSIAKLSDRGFTIRILRLDGTPLGQRGIYSDLSTSAARLEGARQQDAGFETLIEPSQQELVRFYTTPILANERVIGIIQVAQSLDTINDTLEQLITAFLIGIPLLVVLTALGAYLLASRALMPIKAITRTAQDISAHDLSRRLDLGSTYDEVGQLAQTFDQMLDRLEHSFERERQFTADASHELRTPLTAMQTMIAVTRASKRTPDDYEQVLDDFAGETKRLRNLVEDLLVIARGDSRADVIAKPVDISLLLVDLGFVFQPLFEAKQLHFEHQIEPDLRAAGDADDIIRLFMNLLDNAIKYTETGSIHIQGALRGDRIEVSITDTGKGIEIQDLPYVFDRFYRVESSRSSPGSGLGLSIAQSIVHSHQGSIVISSNIGIGTAVTVSLPSSPSFWRT